MVNNLLHSTACEPNCQYQSFPNPTHTTIQIVVFIADVSQLWSVLFPDKNSIFHLISEQALYSSLRMASVFLTAVVILFNTFSAPSAQDLYSLHSSLDCCLHIQEREVKIASLQSSITYGQQQLISLVNMPLARGYARIRP